MRLTELVPLVSFGLDYYSSNDAIGEFFYLAVAMGPS